MILVDSNILIYAVNADSPKYKVAKNFLKSNNHKLVVAHQNVLESIWVLTHPKFTNPLDPEKAQEYVLDIVGALRIIHPNSRTYFLTLEFIKENNLLGNRIFDAYLAATVLSNGVSQIATDNVKDFRKFGISIFNPFEV